MLVHSHSMRGLIDSPVSDRFEWVHPRLVSFIFDLRILSNIREIDDITDTLVGIRGLTSATILGVSVSFIYVFKPHKYFSFVY